MSDSPGITIRYGRQPTGAALTVRGMSADEAREILRQALERADYVTGKDEGRTLYWASDA